MGQRKGSPFGKLVRMMIAVNQQHVVGERSHSLAASQLPGSTRCVSSFLFYATHAYTQVLGKEKDMSECTLHVCACTWARYEKDP
jgi:hypothetical protein